MDKISYHKGVFNHPLQKDVVTVIYKNFKSFFLKTKYKYL